MFKRKDQHDVHQTIIKRGITSHFSRMLKILQQKHVQHSEGDEFIFSNDESNNLCSALEAVFLHGLKEPVTQKLSSYVGLAAPEDAPMYLSFWSVAEKFTHKDVITQLKSLGQVNTEIGLCRAWIRLALNDGLMESYLHSVVVDVKSLRYFYHSYSYLRDHEQPGILKNYLTGLMSLTFKLSLNSSVLNEWSNSTLQLISSTQSAPSATVRQVDSDSAVAKVFRRGSREAKPRIEEESEPIVASKSSTSGQEKPEERAMFNSIVDVEAIRRASKLAAGSGVSYTSSNCSSSSHASCPDPSGQLMSASPVSVGVKQDIIASPHLYPRPDHPPQKLSSLMGADDKDQAFSLDVAGSKVGTEADLYDNNFDTQLALSLSRPRSRRVREADALLISPQGSLGFPDVQAATASMVENLAQQTQSQNLEKNLSLPSADGAAKLRSPEEKRLVTTVENLSVEGCGTHTAASYDDSEPCDDIYDTEEQSPSPTEAGEPEKSNTVGGVALPPAKMDPSLQDAILRKVLGEMDRQADREREAKHAEQDSRGNSQQRTSPPPCPEILMSTEALGRQVLKSKSPDTLVTESDANSPSGLGIEDSSETVTGEGSSPLAVPTSARSGQGVHDPRGDDGGRMVEGEEDEEEFTSGRYGNSLGMMLGWSSEMDLDPPPREEKRREHKVEDKNRSESFASMLRSYLPGSSVQQVVTLDQVIEDLPQEDDLLGLDQSDGRQEEAETPNNADIMQHQDSCLDDFEVVHSPDGSLCGQFDSSRMVFLFRVPQEHGLSHQNFSCKGCSRPIGLIYGQPRLCSLDGGLYCFECHENQETHIPSSIVYDWDFRKKRVCRENFKFLQELESQPLYDIEDLNPKLYAHIPELQELKILRQRLCYLKSYLFTCSKKMAESLRQKVWPREHLYDRRDLYSLTDLHQVQAGSLQRLIKDLVKFSSQHVYSCVLCSQKGYVCEICRNARVIYPFEVETTIRCETCKAVYHKTCMTEGLPCPKCERWGRRTYSSIDRDHPEDYGISPT